MYVCARATPGWIEQARRTTDSSFVQITLKDDVYVTILLHIKYGTMSRNQPGTLLQTSILRVGIV